MTNGEANISLVSRLEAEKESMILQVSVLTDQVEAQGEKIRDLEFTKEEMQIKLEEAEQLLDSVSIFLHIYDTKGGSLCQAFPAETLETRNKNRCMTEATHVLQ